MILNMTQIAEAIQNGCSLISVTEKGKKVISNQQLKEYCFKELISMDLDYSPIEINGTSLMPVRHMLNEYDDVYIPNLIDIDDPYEVHQWCNFNLETQTLMLKTGIVHQTKADAIAHARALLAFTTI